MMKSHLIGRENRLIYRLNEDVQSQVRYTSRVADANASRQEMQRAQNQLATSSNVQSIDPATGQLVSRSISGPLITNTAGGQQATQDMQARAAGVDYNAVQGGTRTGPSSADIMDQATISAQGLRTNFNQTTGNIRSDNTRVNTGQIDEAARERLMDNGMTPTQAALSVQGNRGDVQQAFNQVGTNSASDATGGSSNIESQVRQQYAALGISDPAIINNAITSAIQADNARNQAADMASQKASSSASASAASNAAANEMQQSPQTQRALGSLEIGLAGLPPEDAAAIRAGLQATMGAQDQERSAALGNYGDTMGFIDSSEKKSDALLNGMSQDADAFYKAASKFAEENAARREESAARQREETINRLKWEEDKGRRQMKAANDKQVNSLILGQALGGGFGSSNWIAEVADAEWAGEQALVDLSKEFGFKRADVDIAYTNTLDGIYETAGQKKLEALKEYKADRQNISQLRFASSEKNDERRLTAKQTLNDKIAAIGKEQAAEIKAAAGEVRTTLKELRVEKRQEEAQQKSDAFQLFNFAFGNSTDPALRSAAVTAMRNAGYNLPEDIDLNADPLSFQLATLNNSVKEDQNARSDPFRFTGPDAGEKQALAASALSVIGQLEGGVDLNRAQLDYVNQLLDNGDIEKARTHLRGLAVAALNATQEEAYSSRDTIVVASEALKKDLKAIEGTSQGQTLLGGLREAGNLIADKDIKDLTADDFTAYKKVVQNLKKKMGYAGDPALQRIFAQVENIAGLIINERYGAAVTDGELARAKEYIAFSGNSLSDMVIKLDEYSKFSKLQNEVMLNTKMGMPTDYAAGVPDINSSPSVPSDSDFTKMFAPNGGGGTVPAPTLPQENGTLKSGFLSGIVTGYGSKYWKPGLDVAAAKGSPIRSPVGGTVEKVVDSYRRGYPNDTERGKAQNGGFGNQVVVKYDDGFKLQFSHLDSAAVKSGRIEPGSVLGFVGNTGNTYGRTGVHVDVTGYKPDGSMMTAEEVALYMQSPSYFASSKRPTNG